MIQSLKVQYITFMNSDSFLENLIRKLFPKDGSHSFFDIREAVGVIIVDDDMGVSLLDDSNDGDGANEAKAPRNEEMFDVTHVITNINMVLVMISTIDMLWCKRKLIKY